MADCMTFPNTLDEFLEQYQFKDSEEIYTNGSMLIPVFRVKQWAEHAANIRKNIKAEWTSPDGISICSNCGKAAPYDVEGDIIMYWPNLNYCPNCGAQMTGGKYDY